MTRKRTFSFKKEEHMIEGSCFQYTVAKDSFLMSTILAAANKLGVKICNVHFSDYGKCKISAKTNKELWLLFCYKLIDKLDDYIEKYNF